MKLSKTAAPILAISVLLLPQAKSYAGGNPDVRLAPSPAQRATAVSGNEAPTVLNPGELELVTGTAFMAGAEATDPDSDILSGQAVTPLVGLTTRVERSNDGKLIATVRGLVPTTMHEGQSSITWTVTDAINAPVVAVTAIQVASPMTEGELDSELQRFLMGKYTHGIPETAARKLGPRAVRPLCGLLRNENYKKHWSAIAQALSMIGTPETFDTLQAFVWDRFSGVVEGYTLKALIDAHGSICRVAGTRPEVLQYLIRTSNHAEWSSLPWHRAQGMESLVQALCEISVNGIGTIPSAEARNFLLQAQQSPELAGNAREALEYQEQVIRLGHEGAWMAMLRKLGGGQ